MSQHININNSFIYHQQHCLYNCCVVDFICCCFSLYQKLFPCMYGCVSSGSRWHTHVLENMIQICERNMHLILLNNFFFLKFHVLGSHNVLNIYFNVRKKNSIPGMAESCEVHFLSSPLFNFILFFRSCCCNFRSSLLHIKKKKKSK